MVGTDETTELWQQYKQIVSLLVMVDENSRTPIPKPM